MRDDFGGLADLLHGLLKLAYDPCLVNRPKLDEIDRIAYEQSDVVERIVELVGDARGELAKRRQLSGLDELLLFVAQLLLAPLNLGRRVPQISHDVNHGL